MAVEGNSKVFIKDLVVHNKEWAIKARVMRKGIAETFESRKGPVDILKIILMDEEGTKVLAVLFDQQISRLGHTIEKDKDYLLENGNVKKADPGFPSFHKGIELSFTAATKLSECDEAFVMPKRTFTFFDFATVDESKDTTTMKDVIGIVINVCQTVLLNVGQEAKRHTSKREITFIDARKNTMVVALWGDLADNEGASLADQTYQEPVVLISNVKGSLYQGEVTLATTHISTLEINPLIDEADELRQSFKSFSVGKNELEQLHTTKRMREATPIALKCIINGNLTVPFCTFNATIVRVLNKDHPWYEVCKTCSTRVYPGTTDDTAQCRKCTNQSVSFMRKPMIKVIVFDGAEEAHVTMFDPSEYLIGCTLSKCVEDLIERGATEECLYYRNLVTCQSKEYTFLVRLDQKNADDRARKYIIAQEIKEKGRQSGPIPNITINDHKAKKKLKVEK